MTSAPGARSISVAPERLTRWLDGFAARHGTPAAEFRDGRVTLVAPDGAIARIRPWWPLPEGDLLDAVVAAHREPRRIGAVIVRKQAHAVGVFFGEQLLTGRHASHYVQGRTKAGGWSQQRYARRRANQTARSFDAAAKDASELLLGQGLAGLALGGERAAVASVLARPELAELAALPQLGPFAVPDPNAGVLAGFGELFRRVPIELNQLA